MSGTTTSVAEPGIELSRDEASAIAHELLWTADTEWIVEHLRDCNLAATTPEGTRAALADLQGVIDRLRMEATIRESGGWWCENAPHWRDLQARFDEDAACPDTFTLDSEGAAALCAFCREHLPPAVAYVDEGLASEDNLIDLGFLERRRAGFESLAARFDISIPTAPVA